MMLGTLPGTTIEVSAIEKDGVRHVLSHIFSAGGVVLSQIARMTGLEPHTIQNWVKRGYLSSPKHRQSRERQFARVVIINLLRRSMQLDEIVDLLSYINGKLSDEADDSVDDTSLYCMFCNILCAIGERYPTPEVIKEATEHELADFAERTAGDKKRIGKVLSVMVYAYLSDAARRRIDHLLRGLDYRRLPVC